MKGEEFEWAASCSVTDEHKNRLKHDILALDLVRDVGFADVSQYRKVPGGSTPYEFLLDAKTAVVYIAKTKDIIDTYGTWYVVSLNNFLKQTNDKITAIFKTHGLHSRGVIDERITSDLIGKISFRQLAVLAGLGSIGKNACVLHPVYGPQVVIGVVLSNSRIACDRPLDTDVCVHCNICLRECQTEAITDEGFDRHACKNRRKILGKGCGTPCISLCPVGR